MDEDNQTTSSDVTVPNTPISKGIPKLKRVLCVEDEHFISELYSRALKKAGYEVTVVVDGREGLVEAKTNNYDIILLDIMLPNMIGTDMLKELRNPSINITAKIVVATNLEQKEAARKEIEMQADGYIVKADVTPKQLVAFLQKLDISA